MPVITIRGQLGSRAPEIGKLVAARLNIDYVDREIIADVAANLKYPEQKIEKKEMPPATLLTRIKDALEHGYPAVTGVGGIAVPVIFFSPSEIPLDDFSYLTGLKSVIKELAAGNSIVIRGRGSQFILRDHPGAIHVLTIAPLELRITRVMDSLKADEKTARREIKLFDSSRREFTKRYFKADLEDPANYDLVINTKYLDYKTAVAIVINAVPKN
jgi:Cytidylate kinase-like family